MRIKNIEEYHSAYAQSVAEPEKFWSSVADNFQWEKKWNEVLKWNFNVPDVKWFLEGKLNISVNCLDRHLAAKKDKVAFLWEPNDPAANNRHITYGQLYEEVCRL